MNNMKKQIYKIIIAGFLAFVFLNTICLFYYNVPPRVNVIDNSTDYKWPVKAFYSSATEGVAWGRMNNDGYNNLLDYNDNLSIDSLVMGGSHLEGRNINQEDNMVAILNSLSSDYYYNIGISEHTLPICISNLENAIAKYKPKKYVIIETMNIGFSDNQLSGSLNQREKLPTYSGGLMDILQNMKYLKLIRYQLVDTDLSYQIDSVLNEDLLDQMLQKANNLCEKNNLKLIIVFHPNFTVTNNEEIVFNYNESDCKIFEEVCKNNDIIFINMKQDFINEYKKNNIIPYGFDNSVIGYGHLNKYGHKIIANRIKEKIDNDSK